MIIFNVIFCLVFLYFAYLNLNDPDAWLWVTIYLVGAFCCGAAVFGLYLPVVYIVAIILYLIYAVTLFFVKDGVRDWITKYSMQNIAETMQATKPWIEKTREFFGLLILCAVLFINYLVLT